jgi:hypothetical protein
MLKNKNKGIVLIATGHPYYGRMAYNLSMSIKAIDPDFPICIIHSERSLNHLSESQRRFFDQMILLPEEKVKGFACKLHLDELSPFEETLFLDADMAWLPKRSPNDLMNELSEAEYTGITEGYFNIETRDRSEVSKKYYFWADIDEIIKMHELTKGKIYQWRSEVIYFKKTDNVRSFFATAREVYANHGLKSIIMFGNQIPDELGINISAAIHHIEPHQYKWIPALWPRLHGNNTTNFEEIYNRYYLLSCGSNYATGDIKKLYDRVIKCAANKFHTQHVFPLIDKKSFIPDRAKM